MKILHVLDHSIPIHSGYTFRTREIIKEQMNLGWETSHVTSAKHKSNNIDSENVDGLLFYRTAPGNGIFSKAPILNQLNIIKTLRKRLDEIVKFDKPDIIHAHSPSLNGLAAYRIAKKYDIPIVYECRAFWEDAAVDHGTTKAWSLRYRISRAMESIVFRNVDAVTTICEGLRSDIISRGIPEDKITVIPNAVNVDKFSENITRSALPEKLPKAKDDFIIGFIGSFYSYEGLSLLIKSLPVIQDKIPSIKLVFVGGGPQEMNLVDQASKSKCNKAIIFTGRIPHNEIQYYYQHIDVLVYPRLSMRLTDLVTPLKPLEAMAQRRLVVASDVGGHKELIKNGYNGMLFEAGNKEELAKTVINLFNNRGVWNDLLDNGREYVETERTWKSSVCRYKYLYQKLLS
ncbi:MAG: glycosyltransferase, exosortase A system-associated [Candidatus Brocadiaceae bacterium]|nr:glycosyltransferase, exosortase A system-associated [Candidatus Brocadiaceae bacterium]